jgi:protein TonB
VVHLQFAGSRFMKAPFLDMGALWALADTGRPGGPPGGGLGLALALSLALHLTAAAAILGFGLARGGGEPGAPGPLAMTVNLMPGPGETESGGAEDGDPLAETPLADTSAPEAVLEEPALENPDRPPPDPEAFSLEKAPPEPAPPEPAPPEPEKARPRPPEPVDKPSAASKEGRGKPRAGPPSSAAGPIGTTGPAGSGAGSISSGGGGSGGGSGGGGDTAGYLKGNYEYIKRRIRQHLVYHPQAKRLGIQGTVTVAFIIGADGQARNASVTKTSGHNMLDESALRAVNSASPFPPPPNPARIVVPISFSLK